MAPVSCLQAGLKAKAFQKRIADLNIGPLASRGSLNSSLPCGAVNAVAASFRSHVNHRIAFAGRFGVEDLIAPDKLGAKAFTAGLPE